MNNQDNFSSQEKFWSGEFGDDYTDRTYTDQEMKSNIYFWSTMIKKMPDASSFIEYGCNLGMNLRALRSIDDKLKLRGIEINKKAAEKASLIKDVEVLLASIVDSKLNLTRSDCVFTKGVLIHIDPDRLEHVYENLFNSTNSYILISEYFNPTPVEVNYRGHSGKLFKRDFAKELLDRYPLVLVDYGFVYRYDPQFPLDDQNWFLFRKIDL